MRCGHSQECVLDVVLVGRVLCGVCLLWHVIFTLLLSYCGLQCSPASQCSLSNGNMYRCGTNLDPHGVLHSWEPQDVPGPQEKRSSCNQTEWETGDHCLPHGRRACLPPQQQHSTQVSQYLKRSCGFNFSTFFRAVILRCVVV